MKRLILSLAAAAAVAGPMRKKLVIHGLRAPARIEDVLTGQSLFTERPFNILPEAQMDQSVLCGYIPGKELRHIRADRVGVGTYRREDEGADIFTA